MKKTTLVLIASMALLGCATPSNPNSNTQKPEYRCNGMECKKVPPAPEGCKEIAPDIYDCRKEENR